jgi:hypothetical protein
MSNELVVCAGFGARAHCAILRHGIDDLIGKSQRQLAFTHEATASVTALIEASGDDVVRTADLRAARNLMDKLTASMEQVLLDLRIARDATDGLDHRAAVLLALDLSDTLPWTEEAR